MARVRIIFRAPPSKTGNVLYDWRARLPKARRGRFFYCASHHHHHVIFVLCCDKRVDGNRPGGLIRRKKNFLACGGFMCK